MSTLYYGSGAFVPFQDGNRPVYNRPEDPGMVDTVRAAVNSEWAVPWAYRLLKSELMHPGGREDYNPMEDDEFWGVLTDGVEPTYWGEFAFARSPDHALAIADNLRSVTESRRTLSEAGVPGAIASFGAAILDPVSIAAGFGVGGIVGKAGAAAGRASLGGRAFLEAGLAGMASEVPIEAFLTSQDPDRGATDIILAGVGSFALGGVGGYVGHRMAYKAAKADLNTTLMAMGAAAGDELRPRTLGEVMGSPGRTAKVVPSPNTLANNPGKVFHGTASEFDTLDPERSGGLISFTADRTRAGDYAMGGGGGRAGKIGELIADREGNVYRPEGDMYVPVGAINQEDVTGPLLPADQWAKPVSKRDVMSSSGAGNMDPEYRGIPASMRILERDISGANILDLRKPDGVAVLASLDPGDNRFASQIVKNAKAGKFNWDTTKWARVQQSWTGLTDQLKSRGYDGMAYGDDGGDTFAMFSDPASRTVGTDPGGVATDPDIALKESLRAGLVNTGNDPDLIEEALGERWEDTKKMLAGGYQRPKGDGTGYQPSRASDAPSAFGRVRRSMVSYVTDKKLSPEIRKTGNSLLADPLRKADGSVSAMSADEAQKLLHETKLTELARYIQKPLSDYIGSKNIPWYRFDAAARARSEFFSATIQEIEIPGSFANKAIREAAERGKTWYKGWLDTMKREGLIDEDTYAGLAENTNYFPRYLQAQNIRGYIARFGKGNDAAGRESLRQVFANAMRLSAGVDDGAYRQGKTISDVLGRDYKLSMRQMDSKTRAKHVADLLTDSGADQKTVVAASDAARRSIVDGEDAWEELDDLMAPYKDHYRTARFYLQTGENLGSLSDADVFRLFNGKQLESLRRILRDQQYDVENLTDANIEAIIARVDDEGKKLLSESERGTAGNLRQRTPLDRYAQMDIEIPGEGMVRVSPNDFFDNNFAGASYRYSRAMSAGIVMRKFYDEAGKILRPKDAIPPTPDTPPLGTVRLYRAQPRRSGESKISDWVRESPEFARSQEASNRWFTDDLEEAQWYIKNEYPDGEIVTIDVPADQAEAWRVSNMPDLGGKDVPNNPRAFSRRPDKEFFVPREFANNRTPIVQPAVIEADAPIRTRQGFMSALEKKLAEDIGAPADNAFAKSVYVRFDAALREIHGIPPTLDHASSEGRLWLRAVRRFANTVRNGSFAFAQLPELGRIVAYNGVRNTINALPALREMHRIAKAGKLSNDVFEFGDYLSGIMGGNEWNDAWSAFDPDDLHNYSQRTWIGRRDSDLQKLERVSFFASGFAHIDRHGRRLAMGATLNKFVNDFTRGRPWNAKKLAQLGLSEDDAAIITASFERELKRGVALKREQGFMGQRVAKFRVSEFEDQYAVSRLVEAIASSTNRTIQQSTTGSKLLWQQNPIGQVGFQFWSFAIQGWEKHTLFGFQQLAQGGDRAGVIGSYLTGTLLGAVAYVGQTHLNAIGRGDSEEYLNRAMGEDERGMRILMAGIQRGGNLTFLPQLVDMASIALGRDAPFDARASGLTWGGQFPIVQANPAMALAHDAARAVSGLGSWAFSGDDYSEQDFQALTRIMPLQNHMAARQLWNSIGAGFGEEER